MFFFLAVSAFVVMICSPAFGWRNFRPPVLPERIRMQSQCLWLAPWSCSNKTEEPTNPIYFIWGSTNSMQHIIIIKYLEKLENGCHIHAIFLPLSRLQCEAAILQPRGDFRLFQKVESTPTHTRPPYRRFVFLFLTAGGYEFPHFSHLLMIPSI